MPSVEHAPVRPAGWEAEGEEPGCASPVVAAGLPVPELGCASPVGAAGLPVVELAFAKAGEEEGDEVKPAGEEAERAAALEAELASEEPGDPLSAPAGAEIAGAPAL